MHETKFANEIIFILKHKLEPDALSKPLVVNVRLSPLSHVTPQSLKEAFKVAAESEHFPNELKLSIKTMEFDVYCKECKKISKASAPIFNCPRCKSTDLDIQKEREFIIDSVEIAV
ncbi:MAG: hydrogenase maturation nickel metallochaperone HypA [Candidatus Omnitrophica bacterium]|nr:hydrogenase maturation nickel metallochaperone HypA [Candidatus Omnitrophota bacterium]MDD5237022.1 hydrogenase maturation nickel metallochaperone HypA [Candidatus Omnitrophota bacterium]MDD5611309.1 hydrogenase maturation nickel metallochaperone HypA [Candidatus Omnitrophota bacterium]